MKKTILTIGDIHGTSHWKKILFGGEELFENFFIDWDGGKGADKLKNYPFPKWDKIIFVGDYFDSFVIGNLEMKTVFADIIRLKRAFMDKIVLLIGNHDLHYIDSKHRCSGFRPEMYYDFNDTLRENRDLFKAAHQEGTFLWTHAGLTDSMWNLHCMPRLTQAKKEGVYDPTELKYDEALQFLYEMQFMPIFWAGRGRGGYSSVPGIFWADKRELIKDPLKGINQIVGHTPVNSVETHLTEDGNAVYFIDCQERGTKEPFEIHINAKEEARYSNLKKMKY